jgi:hypothetical protein
MLLLALGAAGSLSAMMIELSPAQLTAQADIIVTGTVTGLNSHWDASHSAIVTDVAVTVEQFQKGTSDRQVTVRVPGGEVGDIGMAVEDMPTFTLGQKVTLHLLRTADRAVFQLLGGWQGAVIDGKPGQVYYSYSGYHRSPASCSYEINSALSGWYDAIRAGATTWTNAGSAFDFTGGTTTERTGPTNDGHNVIWRKSLGSGIIAANYYWYDRKTKLISENDIMFSTNYTWATNGDPNAFDVQDIGTHEMGHCLLLNDLYKSYQSAMTMYGYGAPGDTTKRSLEFGDKDGIKYIYGAGLNKPAVPPGAVTN